MSAVELHWLPECSDWREALSRVRQDHQPWARLVQLANKRLDFVKTNQLDHLLQHLLSEQPSTELAPKPIRLAVLASSTVTNLLPGLRIAALRHGLHLQVYVTGYGQYHQELLD